MTKKSTVTQYLHLYPLLCTHKYWQLQPFLLPVYFLYNLYFFFKPIFTDLKSYFTDMNLPIVKFLLSFVNLLEPFQAFVALLRLLFLHFLLSFLRPLAVLLIHCLIFGPFGNSAHKVAVPFILFAGEPLVTLSTLMLSASIYRRIHVPRTMRLLSSFTHIIIIMPIFLFTLSM